MLDLALGADGEEVLFDAVASAHALNLVARTALVVDEVGGGKRPHAGGTEGDTLKPVGRIQP